MSKIKHLKKLDSPGGYLLGAISLLTAAVGILSGIMVVVVAINQPASFNVLVLFSVMALLLLPTAYLTGKFGRSPLR